MAQCTELILFSSVALMLSPADCSLFPVCEWKSEPGGPDNKIYLKETNNKNMCFLSHHIPSSTKWWKLWIKLSWKLFYSNPNVDNYKKDVNKNNLPWCFDTFLHPPANFKSISERWLISCEVLVPFSRLVAAGETFSLSLLGNISTGNSP